MALILYSNFDTDPSIAAPWVEESCRADAIVVTNEQTRIAGGSSAKFNFKKTDVTTYAYVRAELHLGSQSEAEQWFGFSTYLPSDFVTDPLPEIICQWHEIPDFDLGETWRSPPIGFGIENGNYYLKVLWAAAAVNTNASKDGERTVYLGAVTKSAWVDFAFHINFKYNSTGIIEIWKNKVKWYTLYGPNSFNDIYYPYFKIGIYKWGWDGFAEFSPESERTLYHDEVRIGNSSSNLNEVSPGSTGTTTTIGMDADAEAFLTATGIVDTTQKNAINTLVVSWKAAGVWTKAVAIYPIVGGTAATHKINLKNPLDTDAAYRLAFTGTWLHTASGMTPSGTAYANTFCIPNNVMTLGSGSIGYYSRTANLADSCEMGVQSTSGTARIAMYLEWTNNISYYYAYNDLAAFVAVGGAPAVSSRLHIVSRTSTTQVNGYRDGTSIGSSTNASIGSLPTHPIYIGALNDTNTSVLDQSTRQCSFAFVATGLSGAEVTSITNSVNAYETALGRNV